MNETAGTGADVSVDGRAGKGENGGKLEPDTDKAELETDREEKGRQETYRHLFSLPWIPRGAWADRPEECMSCKATESGARLWVHSPDTIQGNSSQKHISELKELRFKGANEGPGKVQQ